MKKILLLVISVAFGFTLSAQKPKLSVKDAVIGQWTNLYPENMSPLKWQKNTENFTYVKKVGKTFLSSKKILIQQNAKTGVEKELLELSALNKVLQSSGYDTFLSFPEFVWHNSNTIRFISGNNLLIYNIENSKIKAVKFPENAENLDYSVESGNLAYTLENNLFYTSLANTTTQVTNNSDKDIVCGSSYVHRQEFGIDHGIFWSPQGNYLAFYKKDETMVQEYPLVDIREEIAAVEMLKYPMAGKKSEEVTIGVYNLKTKQTVYLQTGKPADQYLTCVTWDPDEKHMYVAVLNREQNHMKLNKYDVENGKCVKTLFEEKNAKYVEPQHKLVFLKAKANQFLWHSQRDNFNHLYLYNTDGKLLKQITKGNWEVCDIVGFDKKDQNVFLITTEESPIERHLYKVNLKSGKKQKITSEPGVHDFVAIQNGKYFIDRYSNLNTPRVIQVLDAKGKIVRNLVKAANPLESYDIGEITIDKLKAADGKTDLYYRLIKPSNFDPKKKYPAIIYVYGGPHAQMIVNSWLGGVRMWQIYMAQEGFVMLTIDNRGSAHRGLEFENVIHRQCGVEEQKDQLKGIELLRSLCYVDMDKVGVHGWSYGGFMTSSLMLNNPDIFKVGVAGGPVIDWKFYEVMYGERYMDTPQENPEGYEKTSLLNKVGKLKGKLMLIHGAIDPVVVWQNSLAFTRECVKQRIPLDYFVYPRAEHNVRGMDRIHLYEKVSQYFFDYLK